MRPRFLTKLDHRREDQLIQFAVIGVLADYLIVGMVYAGIEILSWFYT